MGLPYMKKRNFDIGLDGYVTPTLVPGICRDEPVTYPVPNLDILEEYGFSMEYEIKPNVLEQGDIFRAAGEKRIYPARS